MKGEYVDATVYRSHWPVASGEPIMHWGLWGKGWPLGNALRKERVAESPYRSGI